MLCFTLEIRARKCQIGHNCSFKSLLPTGVAAGVSFRVAFATLCHPGRLAHGWLSTPLLLKALYDFCAHIDMHINRDDLISSAQLQMANRQTGGTSEVSECKTEFKNSYETIASFEAKVSSFDKQL